LNSKMQARKDGLEALMRHRIQETDTRRLTQKEHLLELVILILLINGAVLTRKPTVLLISAHKIFKVLEVHLSNPSSWLNNKISSTAKEAAVEVIKP